MILVLSGPVGSAAAQEIFSWWRRNLLELDMVPGAWVELESEEWAEGDRRQERMRVEVLAAADDGGRWLLLSWPESPADERESWVLRTAPVDSLGEGRILDHLRELYRLLPGGAAAAEDVGRVRSDRLLRRHFQDLFSEPALVQSALPDTVVQGRRLPRRWVRLSETRADTVRMGRREVVYRQEVVAEAQLAEAVPLFGLLRCETTTRLSEAGADSRSAPPLLTRSRLLCTGFGRRETAAGLPEAVQRLRAR
jgi:hypothetical protein